MTTSPTLHSHTHCQVARKTNRTNQNLSKSVSAPDHGRRINNEGTTKCINHWADSANFKVVTFNKICSGLTGKCFGMPNASYTNRWQQV
jgi:hypothetical protein